MYSIFAFLCTTYCTKMFDVPGTRHAVTSSHAFGEHVQNTGIYNIVTSLYNISKRTCKDLDSRSFLQEFACLLLTFTGSPLGFLQNPQNEADAGIILCDESFAQSSHLFTNAFTCKLRLYFVRQETRAFTIHICHLLRS